MKELRYKLILKQCKYSHKLDQVNSNNIETVKKKYTLINNKINETIF